MIPVIIVKRADDTPTVKEIRNAQILAAKTSKTLLEMLEAKEIKKLDDNLRPDS